MAAISKLNWRRMTAVLIAFVLIGSAGCQTFTMSNEDFEKQQHGQMADPEVGEPVGFVGTVAYYGACFGALVAELVK